MTKIQLLTDSNKSIFSKICLVNLKKIGKFANFKPHIPHFAPLAPYFCVTAL